MCALLDGTGVAGRPQEFFERLAHSGLPRQPREYFDGVGDPNLHEHERIEPSLGEIWTRIRLPRPLGAAARALAARLGYDRIDEG